MPVKAEDADTVDIDLTLDDNEEEAVSTKEERSVEICPICERDLMGMNTMV